MSWLYLHHHTDDSLTISESEVVSDAATVGPFVNYSCLLHYYLQLVPPADRQPFFTDVDEEVFQVANALSRIMGRKVDVRIAYYPWTRNEHEYWNISFGFNINGMWSGDFLMYCLRYSASISEITARFEKERYSVNEDNLRRADHIPTQVELNAAAEAPFTDTYSPKSRSSRISHLIARIRNWFTF